MTGIQTPIGGWHRTPHFKTEREWPTHPDMEEAPTLQIADTRVMEAIPEAIRMQPAPKKNPKPEFRRVGTGTGFFFKVYPPHQAPATTNLPEWETTSGTYLLGVLMCCTIVLFPVAMVLWMTKNLRIEKEVLRQIGYKEKGPYTVYWGVYEWKKGKAYRVGLNRPGDGL